MKRMLLPLVVGLVLVAIAAACGTPEPEPVEPTGPVEDHAGLVARLQARGATVEAAGELTQPFFSVDGQMVRVNGHDVQVFEYPTAAAAGSEAAQVLSDGSVIGTTMVNWAAPPHFYRSGRLIVLYVGQDSGIIGLLEEVLGPQFAG
ncbi:MAG TPA: hypothetical protein VLC95_04055, partial [Anaerolineae bacterium]|nr:hypothetical protein [Anaerolineae bacterium]